MRHIARITPEIKLLSARYGPDRVVWAPDYSCVQVLDYPLPPGLNRRATDVLILIPDGYGYGVPYRELIRRPGAPGMAPGSLAGDPPLLRRGGRLRAHAGAPRPPLALSLPAHAGLAAPSDNVLTFLKQVELFLSDPFNPRWERRW